MKVVIEGTQEQVEATLFPEKVRLRSRNGEGWAAEERARIAKQYAILANAFKLVRNKPEDAKLAEAFLDAMRNLSKRTTAILESAEMIIAERS